MGIYDKAHCNNVVTRSRRNAKFLLTVEVTSETIPLGKFTSESTEMTPKVP